jgi:hypothetical protein
MLGFELREELFRGPGLAFFRVLLPSRIPSTAPPSGDLEQTLISFRIFQHGSAPLRGTFSLVRGRAAGCVRLVPMGSEQDTIALQRLIPDQSLIALRPFLS